MKKQKVKKIDLLFVCLPPTQTTIPSPAFSVLKSYLSSQGIVSNIIYANHHFERIDIFDNKNFEGTDIFLPFISIMDEIFHGKKSENIRTFYETIHPTLFLADKSIFEELKEELENRYRSIINDIINEIVKSESKIVGFTSKFHQWIPSIIFAYELKKKIPDITIVSGGWTNSKAACNFLELNKDLFDYAIWGEGEIPLNFLIKYIKKTNEIFLKNIPRLVYKFEGEIIKSFQGNKDSYIDFSKVVLKPDYKDFFNSINKFHINKFIFPIERGRGCNWNKCSFCYLAQGYNFRTKSAEIISKEIVELIQEYNIFNFFFTDNDIIGNDKRDFEFFLDEIITIKKQYPKLKVVMSEIISKDLDYPLIQKMYKAGFSSVQIGIESISETLLKDINKKQSIIDNFFSVKSFMENDIIVMGANLIMNTPNETDVMVRETIDNLHTYRFLLSSNEFKFNLVPLAVSNFSKYLHEIKRNQKENNWIISEFEMTLDDKYFLEIDRYSLMDFFTSQKGNPLWIQMKNALAYYKEKKFSYKLTINDYNYFINYQEFVDGNVIKEILFDNRIYWMILSKLNKNKILMNDLLEIIKSEYNINESQIMQCIKDLQEQGLIIFDNTFNNMTSIINID